MGEKYVTLTLNRRQAATLAAILAHVAGSPECSPRGHATAISTALRSAMHEARLPLSGDDGERGLISQRGHGVTFDNYPFPPLADPSKAEVPWGVLEVDREVEDAIASIHKTIAARRD